ncbi:MAG: oligosaccharide flippase family protein [Flavobacteriales bacterium]|nr:oligosaccharide flippase family protein [Flavobacteriales bacterium]
MVTRKEFVSGFSWNTLTVVFQVVIQLAYTGALARLIPQSSFGLMGIVLGLMGFAEIFSQVGIGPALIQRKEVHGQHITGAFYTALLLGVTFTLTFIGLSPLISDLYGMPALREIIPVVCTSFTISALAVVPRSMMMKEMRFRRFFIASLISIIGGNLVIGLTLAWLGYGVWAYVWALFGQNTLMTIALWYFQPVAVQGKWQWKYTRELIGYGAGSTLFNALNYLATKLDVMLVPYALKGNAPELSEPKAIEASLYERANYIMTQPVTIMAKLSDSVLFSGMSKMQEEHKRLARTIRLAIAMLSTLLIPMVVFTVFYAGDVLQIWLGKEFLAATPILVVLFVAMYFRVVSKIGDSLLRAKGYLVWGSVVKAIYLAMIATGIAFAASHSMVAVAWTIVTATGIHCVMNLWLVHRIVKLGMRAVLRAVLPGLVLGVITALVCAVLYLVGQRIDVPAVISLLIGMTAVGAILFIWVMFFPWVLSVGSENLLNLLPEKIYSIPPMRLLKRRLKGRTS